MTKKGRLNEETAEKLKFKSVGNNEKYKVENICNSAIYARDSETSHLIGLYYLVF